MTDSLKVEPSFFPCKCECGQLFQAGVIVGTDEAMVFHGEPACEAFMTLDPAEYLRRQRLRLEGGPATDGDYDRGYAAAKKFFIAGQIRNFDTWAFLLRLLLRLKRGLPASFCEGYIAGAREAHSSWLDSRRLEGGRN